MGGATLAPYRKRQALADCDRTLVLKSSSAVSGLTRRSIVVGTGCLAAAAGLGAQRAVAADGRNITLIVQKGRTALAGAPHPETDVWCYSGGVPGPEIRVRRGGRLRVLVENRLDEETTVHWHGVRVPNAMDGVPHLTQAPIAPGASFTYEFACPDAGTFWYHPHQRSHEQVGRGLYGALVVEEEQPLEVDRDIAWVLDDWRLLKDASISDDFGNFHDVSHAGRIGNTVTLNGVVPEVFPVRSGERIRLRLINAANARIFGLVFKGHEPLVIAVDGQPVEPHVPDAGHIILGPAMRVDVVVDMAGKPGERFEVIDSFYKDLEYRLLEIAYSDDVLREGPFEAFVAPRENGLPEPDVGAAERHEVVLGGGMMGRMASAMVGGKQVDIRTMMHNGLAWAINGVAATGHVHDPLLTFRRGKSYLLSLVNDTAWPHPMHLHGHSFRVVARNGRPTRFGEWQDTVLIPARESADIAFVADNPGDWMFHCHILEHQLGGMMGVVRVS